MYSLREYGNMIADSERFSAYRTAIAHAVRTGDIVAEIGCGPGVFAFLACQAGAKRVYAIESEPVIAIAKQIAAENCFADRVKFLHEDSRRVKLPERVRVIISDIRGALPFFGTAFSTIADARERFLSSTGLLIPQSDVLKIALIEAPAQYQKIIFPWSAAVPDLNLSIPLAHQLNTESYHHFFTKEQLLTEPKTWCVLDYQRGVSEHVSAELTFAAQRPGTAHGLCIWFEAKLFENVGYSTGPGTSKSGISGQLFLPWLEPVSLSEGQVVNVLLNIDLVGREYLWRWQTLTASFRFRQSTLQGAILSGDSLGRRAADFVPALSEEGEADRWLLDAMDGNSSLQQIAQSAAARYPEIFKGWEDALSRAAELAEQFSR